MRALNNVTTADNYTAGNTLTAPDTVKINITVSNAAIFYSITDAPSGRAAAGSTYQPETFLVPGFYNFARRTNGVRVRSGAAGVPAQVTVEAISASD